MIAPNGRSTGREGPVPFPSRLDSVDVLSDSSTLATRSRGPHTTGHSKAAGSRLLTEIGLAVAATAIVWDSLGWALRVVVVLAFVIVLIGEHWPD